MMYLYKKIVIIFSIILFSTCSNPKKTDYALVNFFIGNVKLNGISINIGDPITENSEILTGKNSSCDIKIGDSIIRIKENSKMKFAQLLSKDGLDNTTLNLDKGYILCKPKKLLKGERFMVQTPTAVAGVRGTQFTVQTDIKKTTQIKVFSGKVKVVKRVKSLDKEIDKILENVKPIAEKEKIVITLNDAKKAETIVEKTMSKENSIAAVAEELAKNVRIDTKDIGKFKIEDFKNENKEIIKVAAKPIEVIKKIKSIIKKDKELPKILGRILITRYEVYFIKDGKVDWEGDVITSPITQNDKIYIASGDFVFCASSDGPVLWRKEIKNKGKFQIREDILEVETDTGLKKLDLQTGELKL